MLGVFILFLEVIILFAQIAIIIFFIEQLSRGGAPYVPSSRSVALCAVNALTLPTNAVFYDLGSGDGRMLRLLSLRSPTATCIGIERSLVLCLWARFLSRKFPNISIVHGDIFREPLHKATHVFTYLFSDVMDQFLPKAEHEFAPNTILLSLNFKFSQKPYDRKIDIGDKKHALYEYTF